MAPARPLLIPGTAGPISAQAGFSRLEQIMLRFEF
jgi:hypothetical protein